MPDSKYALFPANVYSVDRTGNDIYIVFKHRRAKYISYTVTVVFTGVSKVDSLDQRNELVVRELDELGPKWQADFLDFEHNVARLGVSEIGMHESYPVMFTISCRDLTVTKRPALLRTLVTGLAKL